MAISISRQHMQLQVLLFYPDGKRSSSTEGGMGVGMGAVLPAPPGAGNGNGFEGVAAVLEHSVHLSMIPCHHAHVIW
jgi:hypothetical protein